MAPLSTEVRDVAARRRRAADRWLRLGAPALVALVFIGALVLEGGGPEYDLRIVSPANARPGEAYAVRGGLYGVKGSPAQRATRARARLLGPEAQVLAEGQLRATEAGPAGAFEGRVPLPAELRGRHRLEVCAPASASDPTCGLRQLNLAAEAPGLELVPRLQTEGQRLSRGTLEVLRDPGAPVALDLRVPGGACQPELPCPVLVRTAPPGLRLGVERSGVVRAVRGECSLVDGDAPPADTALAAEGPHRCTLALADPQGVVHLVVHDAAGPLARRTVQLPVALGMPRLELDVPLAQVGVPLRFESRRLLPEQPLAVDVLREARWVDARSFPAEAAEAFFLTFDAPGLHRVFARTSASGGAAALRLVLVRPAGAPEDRGLTEAIASLGSTGDAPGGSAAARARWAFAAAEDVTPAFPPGVSSASQLRLGKAGAASRRRALAALLIVLAGVLVAVIVARRGLAADAEARALLAEAEVPGANSASRRRAMTRRTLLVAGATLLGFVLAAAALLSRGCLA